uniref:Uncharacterized protein n=1 Tax=Nothoprocta perdicaria TaxID=30464 RepID=A0A8C7EFT4_NOTPE
MEKGHPPVTAGSIVVPYGHAVGNEKWRGSEISQRLQGECWRWGEGQSASQSTSARVAGLTGMCLGHSCVSLWYPGSLLSHLPPPRAARRRPEPPAAGTAGQRGSQGWPPLSGFY